LTSDRGLSERATNELRQLEVELARLASAIARGGDVPTLVDAMRTRKDRCRELRLHLKRSHRISAVDVQAVRTTFE
jgi:hypothetical protein